MTWTLDPHDSNIMRNNRNIYLRIYSTMNIVKSLLKRGMRDDASSPSTLSFAQSAGINQSPSLPNENIPTSESGIALSALIKLADALKGAAASFDTYTLVAKLIKPVTATRKCR